MRYLLIIAFTAALTLLASSNVSAYRDGASRPIPDLILKAAVTRPVPLVGTPHNWGASFNLTITSCEKGSQRDQKIYLDIGVGHFDGLDAALRADKTVQLSFIKKDKKLTTSGFTDSQGVFWMLVAWE